MCPACLATISMIVAGVFSTGGVTVLAANTLLRKTDPAKKRSGIQSSEEFHSLDEKEKQSCHKAA